MPTGYVTVYLEDEFRITPFSIHKVKRMDAEVKEELRARDQLKQFIEGLQSQMEERIHFIGVEERYGSIVHRYLFAGGGFIELIQQEPLFLKGHFLERKKAIRFQAALKRALKKQLPNSPKTHQLIKSIQFVSGEHSPNLVSRWVASRSRAIRTSGLYTVMAGVVVILFELIQAVAETISIHWLGIRAGYTEVIAALAVAFLFEPIRTKAGHLIDKLIESTV